MKKLFLLVGLALLTSITSQAQNYSSFATPGTAIGVSTNYAILPAESAQQFNSSQGIPIAGEPVVNYLNLSGLSSAAISLQSFISTNATSFTATNNTTTNTVVSTNGWVAGWAVIHHINAFPRFANEAVYVSTLQATNQLVFAIAPVTACQAGDQLFQETAGASIPVASSTTAVAITGPGILTGQRSKPYLLLLSSTAGTNTINAANAQFVP